MLSASSFLHPASCKATLTPADFRFGLWTRLDFAFKLLGAVSFFTFGQYSGTSVTQGFQLLLHLKIDIRILIVTKHSWPMFAEPVNKNFLWLQPHNIPHNTTQVSASNILKRNLTSNTKPIFLFKYIELEEFHPKETFHYEKKILLGRNWEGKLTSRFRLHFVLRVAALNSWNTEAETQHPHSVIPTCSESYSPCASSRNAGTKVVKSMHHFHALPLIPSALLSAPGDDAN